MMKIELFSSVSDDIEIFLSASIEDDGDLLISGQDLGKRVMEFWGDSDYEYWLCIRKDYLDILLGSLYTGELPPDKMGRDKFLLDLLKKDFSNATAVTSLQELCKLKNIPCEFSNYI